MSSKSTPPQASKEPQSRTTPRSLSRKLFCYPFSATKRDLVMPPKARELYDDIKYHMKHINALRERLIEEGYEVSFLDNQ
jgi:hypothetical protein